MIKVQTGVRIERRLLNTLKALATHLEMSLSDLIAGMVLYSFEGRSPFQPPLLRKIDDLKEVYGVTFGASSSHRLPDGDFERVQTGIRLEKTLLKVMKGLAAYLEMSLGDLVEGIVLYAFEGTAPFVSPTTTKIEMLKEVFELGYGVEASHPGISPDR